MLYACSTNQTRLEKEVMPEGRPLNYRAWNEINERAAGEAFAAKQNTSLAGPDPGEWFARQKQEF